MSVWFAVPSKRPPDEAEICLSKGAVFEGRFHPSWREQGYKIALWRDEGDPEIKAELLIMGAYQGYHHAVNALCRAIMALDPDCQWIVSGGDDMCPDPVKRADEIATECTEHFCGTFGVMQPTGDKWGDPQRICGSPWMGREFCRRMYGGRGPFCELYWHMWGDQELHEICKKRGILWNRDDLSHYHHHWIRVQQAAKQPLRAPKFLDKAIPCYESLMPLYKAREKAFFPGHEPID